MALNCKLETIFIGCHRKIKMTRKLDYIIVGQGLVGSAVALQLLRRNKKILVIDRPLANSSSRIAVGLFNPITGRANSSHWQKINLPQILATPAQ